MRSAHAGLNRLRKKAEVAALKGHELVAGGSPPGKPSVQTPDPERVTFRQVAESDGNSTLSGSEARGGVVRGRCPIGVKISPTVARKPAKRAKDRSP